MTESSAPTINSVSHAVRLLELFRDGRPLTLTEISTRLNLPRATVTRLLRTLLAHELLLRDGKKYRLSLHLLEIAAAALSGLATQEVIYPRLAALVRDTGMTGHYAVLDGQRAGYIAVVDAPHMTSQNAHVGWRAPLSTTAVGKVLLAWSDPALLESVIAGGLPNPNQNSITGAAEFRQSIAQVRQVGYAINNAEMFSGLYCFAVPVSAGEQLLGALALSGPQKNYTTRETQTIVKQLQAEAQRLGHVLSKGADG